MTDYRAVARHVRYWRGQIHKWSTVYPLTGSITAGNYGNVITKIHDLEQLVNYRTAASVQGGLYEVALYDHATGGVPVAVVTYFPFGTPGSWIPYTGTGWTTTSLVTCPEAETALQVEWLAGLSVSGKPVSFKKWYHMVPNSTAVGGAPDVAAGDVTNLTTTFTTGIAALATYGVLLGNASRLAAATPVVRNFYGNHQMPRGRRRKALVTAGGRYTGPTVRVPSLPVTAD